MPGDWKVTPDAGFAGGCPTKWSQFAKSFLTSCSIESGADALMMQVSHLSRCIARHHPCLVSCQSKAAKASIWWILWMCVHRLTQQNAWLPPYIQARSLHSSTREAPTHVGIAWNMQYPGLGVNHNPPIRLPIQTQLLDHRDCRNPQTRRH